jgi:hypothetical protein
MKVWITYAYEDKEFVEKLKSVLKQANLEVLDVENEILPGDSIVETIYKAISESDIIFVILSKSSSGRQWFSTEIGMIISEIRNHRHKKIIPILKDKEAEIPTFINQYQFFDASNPKNVITQFEKLLASIKFRAESNISNKELDKSANEMFLTRDFLLEKEKLEYEKQRNQKQKLISVVFLTTILTTFVSILAFFLSTEKLFHLGINLTSGTILTLLIGVLTGVVISGILNLFKRK